MPDPPAKHCATPSQAYHSDLHEGQVCGDDLYSTTAEWITAEDRIRWTYFLLGCTILLPWNALVNGTPFFLSRLGGSPFYPTLSSCLSTVYALTKLTCQFYCTITSKQSSPSRRIIVSTIAVVFLVTSLCFSTYMRGTPSAFFIFVLFSSASLAVSAGYLFTATYAGAALLGASFLQAVLSGQAAVAVAVSIVQVTSSVLALWRLSPKSVERADGRDDQAGELAARIFFGVSAIFVATTLVAYTWLAKEPIYKLATRTLEQHHTDELTSLLTDDFNIPQTEANSRVYRVFEQNSIYMFSIACVFAVTLVVFPAITVRVQSVNPSFHPLLFTAVHYLVFNVGDLVGRYSCSSPRLLVWFANKILAMSLSRTLFIPLTLLCNIHRPETTPISPIINSDILFMFILLTMGYTNGFVSSIATLAVSSLEYNPRLEGRRENVDVAATLAGYFAIVGIAFGALCSFGV